VAASHDQAGCGQRLVDIVALAINGWIDLVGYQIIPLITLETDIVGGGDTPER